MYDGGSDERPTSLSLHRQQSQRSARLLQAASNSSPLLAQLFSHTTKACGGTYSAAAATYLMMRCGLRPFALPRSLIPPKSHAALVSFNQQYQPSLEANLAGLPMLLAVARRCRAAAATVATMDAIDGTLAAFSITRLTSSYT